MKMQMNIILALYFLVLLSFGIVECIKCLGCNNVGPDNLCKGKPYECTAGLYRYCFTQKISRMRKTVKITRGCTSVCRSEARLRNFYLLETWCCYRHHCNSINAWNKISGIEQETSI